MIRLKQNTENTVALVVGRGSSSYLLKISNGTADKVLVIKDEFNYPDRCNNFKIILSGESIEDLENATTDLHVGIYSYEVHPYLESLELSNHITIGILTVSEETEQEILTETKQNYIDSIYGNK